MAPNTDKEPLADVQAVIRSLVIIKKKLVTLKEINSDYRDMEGENIPFNRYNFHSLQDMLLSGDFNLTKSSNGETIVSAKLSKTDEHMAKLIQETKTKKSMPAKRMGPSSSWQTMKKPTWTQTSNKPTFSRPNQMTHKPMYRSMQNLSHADHHHHVNRNGQHPQYNWGYVPPQRMQPPQHNWNQIPPLPTPSQYMRLPVAPLRMEPVKQFNWTPLPKEMMPRHPIVQPEITLYNVRTTTQPPPPQLTATGKIKITGPVDAPRSVPPPPQLTTTGKIKITGPVDAPRPVPVVNRQRCNPVPPVQQRETVLRQVPMQTTNVPKPSLPLMKSLSSNLENMLTSPKKSSIQSRLQVQIPKPTAPKSDGRSIDSGLSGGSREARVPISFVEKFDKTSFKLAPNEDATAKLTALCNDLSLSPPRVSSLRSGSLLVCRVTIDGKTFSAHGSTDKEARQTAAEGAISTLQVMQQRKKYPVTQEDNHDLAIRLHDLLLQYPHGVFEKNLPEIFQQATGMSLPENWTALIMAYSRFFCIDSGPLAHVVYAKELTDMDSGEALQLPWADEHWNIYVTHVLSPSVVWARIIGVEFSVRWDKLMTDIEWAMSLPANRKPCSEEELLVNSIYLVQRLSSWYRVRCMEVDNGRFLGFFVDQGNEEWLPTDGSLFFCEQRFQGLPGQAVTFTMFGMETVEENPHARPILERALQDKAFVAEIRTNAEDHVEGARIRAVFYDTSGNEDINLSETLYEEICKAAKPPQLKGTGVNQVYITHVTDQGDVFCQLRGSDKEYVQKTIDKLVLNTESLSRHRGLHETGANAGGVTRYLVFDRLSGNWSRAVLKVRHPQSRENVMFCLDTGCQVKVAVDDIYHLEPLSRPLSRYPPLAIRCQLYDIPHMQPTVLSRIKGLLEAQPIALAKVIVNSEMDRVPQINLYQRVEAKNNHIIVCVNDTLRMESDLKSSFAD